MLRTLMPDALRGFSSHYGDQAEAVEQRVLAEVDVHFETGAGFCRAITDGWLDLVNSSRSTPSRDLRITAQAK